MSAKKWAILPSIISPRPQALKEEIRNENQDKRKIFDPGGIWTHDLLIRTLSLYQLSYEAKLSQVMIKYFITLFVMHAKTGWLGRSCLDLYYHCKHVKNTINHQVLKIYTTSACILRGRNIFWTPRADRTTAGLMPLGLFLFPVIPPPSGRVE